MLNPSKLALASALSLGVLLSGCQSMPTSTSAQ